jgi:hypothetical protein
MVNSMLATAEKIRVLALPAFLILSSIFALLLAFLSSLPVGIGCLSLLLLSAGLLLFYRHGSSIGRLCLVAYGLCLGGLLFFYFWMFVWPPWNGFQP